MAEIEEPSKPQNPYWIWLSESREALKKEAGTASIGVLGKLAGTKWKAMTPAQKAPFEKKAEAVKAKYEKDMEKFVAAGGQKGKRRQEKADAKKNKGSSADKKAKKEAAKESGKPSKPQNAYWLYLAANRAAIIKEAGDKKGSVVAKLAGQKWKALPEKDKAPFEKTAAEAKKVYDKALEEWKKTAGAAAAAGGDDDDEEEEEDAEE